MAVAANQPPPLRGTNPLRSVLADPCVESEAATAAALRLARACDEGHELRTLPLGSALDRVVSRHRLAA